MYAAPDQVHMADMPTLGRRPVGEANGQALAVCPGIALEHTLDRDDAGLQSDLKGTWGPVFKVWEGFAANPDIRRAGSSGGAATALALHAIERRGMAGVLHTAAREDAPYLNQTVVSRSREELLGRTGSRYAPASPCEGLGEIEHAEAPCVFIGKPCDVAAAQKARALRPGLDRNLDLTIAFFCAGTPSTQGTLDLLKSVGVDDPGRVRSLRYRGQGWPGRWTVRWEGEAGQEHEASLSYEESWGFLQKYRQWRCYICPDHTGEFADVAVGDPWYRPVQPGEPGKSLIVARTRRGVAAVEAAAAAGYLVLEREDPELLPRSQPNLLRTKAALWGRLTALRLGGAGCPRFKGFALGTLWLKHLTVRQRAQSIAGTFRRIRTKNLRRTRVPRSGAAGRPAVQGAPR